MLKSLRSLRKFCTDSKLLNQYVTTKRTKDTKIRKLLHFNFLLRALRELRGEMSVSTLVAALPRTADGGSKWHLKR